MFLFLSKVLPPLVLPMGLGLLLLLGCGIALLRRRRGAALALVGLALLVLWPLSTPVVSDLLLSSLERRYPVRLASAVPPADAVVILGGGTTAGEGGHLEI